MTFVLKVANETLLMVYRRNIESAITVIESSLKFII